MSVLGWPTDPDDVQWPHGWWDSKKEHAICPDGELCARQVEWGRACPRDVGGDHECERLPPPDGWFGRGLGPFTGRCEDVQRAALRLRSRLIAGCIRCGE